MTSDQRARLEELRRRHEEIQQQVEESRRRLEEAQATVRQMDRMVVPFIVSSLAFALLVALLSV